MNVAERNQLYLKGVVQGEALFPHELKAGHASAFEFDWFIRTFPCEKLLVVSSDRFDGTAVRGVTLEDFLLDESL